VRAEVTSAKNLLVATTSLERLVHAVILRHSRRIFFLVSARTYEILRLRLRTTFIGLSFDVSVASIGMGCCVRQ
jgi:hypothetical protein